MSMSRFAAASAQCDVMLDSIGWSGGNTTLEALAQDLPVVTFEGDLMRGRVSAGMLRMMGMPETVAGTIDDYVALGGPHRQGPGLAGGAQARVARDRQRLYRDRTCIAALEDFLDRAARGSQRRAASPPQLPTHARSASAAHDLTRCLRARRCAPRRSWLPIGLLSWLANADQDHRIRITL